MLYQILNACFYGVGQKRERIIVIGIRNDLKDYIVFQYPEPSKEWTTLKEALSFCPKSEGQAFSEAKRRVMELVPPGGCWVDLPEDIAKDYMGKSYYSGGGRRGMARRIAWDEPICWGLDHIRVLTLKNRKMCQKIGAVRFFGDACNKMQFYNCLIRRQCFLQS